jgi:hypothetical protein
VVSTLVTERHPAGDLGYVMWSGGRAYWDARDDCYGSGFVWLVRACSGYDVWARTKAHISSIAVTASAGSIPLS